ncbi:MAG: hypothetical protein JO060_07095, partial [Candidatus Eremiobacteraeota bacterium]|nr:hypothetical protein [Candidatus Eremiobacteraeota bacterium]
HYLQQLLARDPWREDGLRALMSLRYENGDRSGALRACSDFEERLRREIGASLMEETVALRSAITNEAPIQKLPVPNNLPVRTSSFVGRDEDVNSIARTLREHRLVTLVGAGGVGKTRTATHVAGAVLEEYSDGVWFVELGPITDPALIPAVTAATLGVREAGERPLLELLLDDVQKRSMLIVFDNCEHLVADVAVFIERLLRHAPGLRVLTTSRESLRVQDEAIYRVPSLAFPSRNGPPTAADAARFGAVKLFVGRAAAANPAVQLTDETAPLVCDICRRLDGIALALELAAARVKVLSLRELAERLDDRFELLTAGSRTALPRQQTMRALIDWSYDLLTDEERALLRRVGIFAAGWTLEAAKAVCADALVLAEDLLDLHHSLVDKSLIVAEIGETSTRYRLLESTRAYALERLSSDGEQETISRRFAEWVAAFADRVYDLLWSEPIPRWLALVEPERENARAALTWALEEGRDPVLGGKIAGSLSGLWSLGGLRSEGRRAIEAALAVIDERKHPAVAARLWRSLAALTIARRQAEAAERALDLYRQLDDRAELADAYRQLASGLHEMLRLDEADAASQRALELLRETGRTGTRRYALTMQGRADILLRMGRTAEARELLGATLMLHDKLGTSAAACLVELAELEFSEGDARLALAHVNEAVAVGARLRSTQLEATALCNAAAYRLALGEIDEAHATARQSLALALRAQEERIVPIAILHHAAVAAMRGDPRRAARFLGYVDGWFEREHYARELTEQRTRELVIAKIEDALTPSEMTLQMSEGKHLSDEAAAGEALALQSSLLDPRNHAARFSGKGKPPR